MLLFKSLGRLNTSHFKYITPHLVPQYPTIPVQKITQARQRVQTFAYCSYNNLTYHSAIQICSIIRYNSMKYQKSSCSLHSKPTLPFQEQNSNTITYHKSGLTLKRLNTNPRESTVVYNARGRLNTCITHLHELKGQVEEMIAKNKEIRVGLGFIRQEYHLRKIAEIQGELSNSVKQLKKKVTIANRSDLLKFQSLNQIVGSLHKTQKEIRGKVEQIETRVYLLQNIMGSGQALVGLGSE